MFQFLVDVNCNEDIVRGLEARALACNLVLARVVGLRQASDEALLAWAANQDRIVISHDRNTLAGLAVARVKCGQPMPGVFIVDDGAAIGRILADLELVIACSRPEEWRDQVRFVPF